GILEVGANQGRRALGTQGEGAPFPILEGVELLPHDVRRFAHAPDEEVGRLEERRAGFAIAVEAQDRAPALLQPLPALDTAGQNVARAAGHLVFHVVPFPVADAEASSRLRPIGWTRTNCVKRTASVTAVTSMIQSR